MRIRHLADAVVAAFLLALVSWYAGAFLDFSRHPEEDAAMLLRYARHLAQGHGVVWNVGEPPVDGATDVLFLALVALVHRGGAGLEAAARGVGLIAHVATVCLVYASIRRLHGAPPWVALPPAVYLAVGTGLRYVTASYGTPLFVLVVSAGWYVTWRTTQVEASRVKARARLLGLLAVLMGIARPEGALVGLLFLGGALIGRGRDTRAVVAGFASGFLLPGLAYFAGRWLYFGQPLPNPFYKKGGGVWHMDVLERSLRNVVRLGAPFLAVLAAGTAWRATRRIALAALVPIAGFTLMWVLVSDETNYFMRFRYPILPVILVAWVPVAQGMAGRLGGSFVGGHARGATVAAALATCAALGYWQHQRFAHIEPQRMGLYDVATLLRPHAGRGYTLATTEAGLLPLYSEWRAVDAWGLNDRWIARHGGISEEYLDRYRPEVIAIHAYYSPAAPPEQTNARQRGLGPAWFDMAMTLQKYAESRGYRLAAAFGRAPDDTHYYYVRRDFPESEALAARIRGMRYLWNGHPARDYAAGTAAADPP